MNEIFIGRQPIYNAKLEVDAYELLYRGAGQTSAHIVDDDNATSQVLINSFIDFGIERIVGSRRAYINMPKSFIIGETPIPFSAQQCVLEILENVVIDAQVLKNLKALSEVGYTLALDDFVYHERHGPLLDIVDQVKIDITETRISDLEQICKKLRKHNVKLVAEKIETPEEFELVKSLQFDYFQGYFFCKPNILHKKTISPNRLVVLKLLAMIHDPTSELSKISAVISKDIALSYKLLRFINSVYIGLPNKIESIHHAVVYLGLQNIKNLVTLISLSNIESKTSELVVTAMVRAKMCENIAATVRAPKDIFFTIGLLSVLDAMMDIPMNEILETLPLNNEISAAILKHEGRGGQALRCVINYEQGKWDKIQFESLDPGKIAELYLNAVAWSNETRAYTN